MALRGERLQAALQQEGVVEHGDDDGDTLHPCDPAGGALDARAVGRKDRGGAATILPSVHRPRRD
ncbi:hypothetical protein GCM10009706_26240 [Curtobacterium citreum]|nr:hypothetical protein GCM10009706_26240 [Curtobacterium citreum]